MQTGTAMAAPSDQAVAISGRGGRVKRESGAGGRLDVGLTALWFGCADFVVAMLGAPPPDPRRISAKKKH